jgi:gluconate kinase
VRDTLWRTRCAFPLFSSSSIHLDSLFLFGLTLPSLVVSARPLQQDRIPWLHKVRETGILLTSSAGIAALDAPSQPSPEQAEAVSASHELTNSLLRVNPDSLAARREKVEKGQKREREALVVACSALTVQYRNLLRGEEARFKLPDGREIVSEEHLERHIETFFVYRSFFSPFSSVPVVNFLLFLSLWADFFLSP